MSRCVTPRFAAVLLVFCLLLAAPLLADEPAESPTPAAKPAPAEQFAPVADINETDDAEPALGPVVTDPTKQPIAVPGPAPAPAPASSQPRVVDVEKEPWLIESVGLPSNHPALSRSKMIWAQSFLWQEAPPIEVEKWLGDAPDMKGKYILVEFWATWCPPCRRSLPLLNYYHEKYGDELCVIAVSETDEDALRAMKVPITLDQIQFHMGIDTQRRTANALGVFGIPHAVIIEPQYGCVIWEGMPTMPGHELRPEIIERILEVGRKIKAQQAAEPATP